MPGKRWSIAPPLTDAARLALGVYPPLIAQLLFNRGLASVAEAEAFLDGQLAAADDPHLLTGLPETVDRLHHAIRAQERIAIYGDYDTDGVTATALLVQVLTALGANVEAYIPDRETEGYGLNHEALKKLKHDHHAGLVVSVDCGIRSVDEAETARTIGLDLIITDHHSPGAELPRGWAVINPKQAGDQYPEKGLAGVGVAYKIAQGLIRPMTPKPAISGSDVLDLVALGTVADLAPLAGENRKLVREGLRVMKRPRREGLRALMSVARVKPDAVDAMAIGFGLGPRLNAAGRLESAMAAYELLATTDVARAQELANQLEAQNVERQALTREMHAHAREIALATAPDAPLLFAAHESFRPGVVGLAAARLADEFYRPAIVATRGPDETKGSARSIREFHITEALDQCKTLLVRHGGHAAAAGFTARTEQVDELANRLRGLAEVGLRGLELRPTVRIDAEVALQDLSLDLVAQLQRFEPCGYGNPAPLLASREVRVVEWRHVGQDNKHLKLKLSDGKRTVDAIAFNQGEAWRDGLPARIDVAYHLEVNEWNGNRRLQLNVRDIHG